MGKDYRNNRPRGNLLPKTTAPEPPKPCMKFQMNVEHYKRTGEVIPLTESEEFIPPADINPFNDWVSNANSFEDKEEETMSKKIENRPSKVELREDMKSLTNGQIAEKYDVSKSTAEKWIRENGLQRSVSIKKEDQDALLAIIQPKNENKESELVEVEIKEVLKAEPMVDKPEEQKPSSPSMVEYSGYFMDEPQPELPKVDEYEVVPCKDLVEKEIHEPRDPDEKIWKNIEADIKALRLRKHERTDKEFDDRLRKLFECC